MPIPSPDGGESQDGFVARCMADKSVLTEYGDSDKRAAVCFGAWRKKSAKMVEPQAITKIDEHEQLVFGWFNVAVKADGELLTDRQDDVIEPTVLEKAAYEYVVEGREGDFDHDGVVKATLVESMVFTGDKVKAIESLSNGVVKMDVPEGWWWGGFKIHDRDDFQKVLSGEKAMFSIEGTAERVEVLS